MATSFSTTLRNARLDAITTAVGTGGSTLRSKIVIGYAPEPQSSVRISDLLPSAGTIQIIG